MISPTLTILRKRWNALQRKAGTRTRVKQDELVTLRRLLDDVRSAGSSELDLSIRSELQSFARAIADLIFKLSKEYPSATIAPPVSGNRLPLGLPLVAPHHLKHGAENLFGREEDLKRVDAAWENPKINILVILAWGGVGKTSLIIEWMARKAAADWAGFERVFDWSFYSQGTREQGAASADTFIEAALAFFGDAAFARSSASRWDKGARLAQIVAQRRSLLVLDGLEPLQHPPGPLAGQLKDASLAALLKGLAINNSGLCIVTTREGITDLDSWVGKTVAYLGTRQQKEDKYLQLSKLSTSAGVDLLKAAGVRGPEAELERIVERIDGHALTLNLLGRYLALAHDGDIRQCDSIEFEKADSSIQGGHAFKTMAAYEKWLAAGGKDGLRQLAVLRLLGMFDRPADAGCLAELRGEPAIPGLTELLVGLSDEDWNLTLSFLSRCGLVSIKKSEQSQPSVDAHPLIREYFARELLRKASKSLEAAHLRLYKHLAKTPDKLNPTLVDLLPLYEAVSHGCKAGCAQEAYDQIYVARINRSTSGSGAYYASREYGAPGADFAAVKSFFRGSWDEFVPGINDQTKFELLTHASFLLHLLGRVDESRKPLECAEKLLSGRQIEDVKAMADLALQFTRTEWRSGNISESVRRGKEAITLSDKVGSGYDKQRITSRVRSAYASFLSGKREEARSTLQEAEQLQAWSPQQYGSENNFYIFELLIADAERASWLRFMGADIDKSILEVGRNALLDTTQRFQPILKSNEDPNLGMLDRGLYNLILGRLALYTTQILSGADAQVAKANVGKLLECAASTLSSLSPGGHPFSMISRAWLRQLKKDKQGAREDLDEAWRIAERGAMMCHRIDLHLCRARLFFRAKPYPWQSRQDDLRAARQLIERCGYWRRKGELEDAEKVILSAKTTST